MSPHTPTDQEIDLAAGVLKLLSDRTRLAILALLNEGEQSVSSIAEMLDRPVPAISQHLAKLRMANLVTTRKEGTSCFYSQPDEHLNQLVVNSLHFAEHMLYDVPPHHHAS